MIIKKVPDSELQIMLALWQKNEPMTRSEVESIISKEKPLAKTTVLTLLTRLEKKGFVEITRSGREHLYKAIITKDEYRIREGQHYLRTFFDNSVSDFVVALANKESLSKNEIAGLRQLIDTLSEKGT